MGSRLIGYDLNDPGQDYSALIEAIKAEANGWWHHLDSTWIINSDKSCTDIRNNLKAHIDSGDELLVVDVTGGPAAWSGFSAKGSQWLKDNL